jgi:hypothetical protein
LHQVLNNGTLKGKENENPIYYTPLVIFQKYKITILSNCDTPYGSFYYFCTHKLNNIPVNSLNGLSNMNQHVSIVVLIF